MRLRILFFLFSIVLSGSLFSCSDKDDVYVDRSNEDNQVKVVVRNNTPGVLMKIGGFALNGETLSTKTSVWEKEVTTKLYGARVNVECEDAGAIITAEIYVNGKLQAKKEGSKSIWISAEIKKDHKK